MKTITLVVLAVCCVSFVIFALIAMHLRDITAAYVAISSFVACLIAMLFISARERF